MTEMDQTDLATRFQVSRPRLRLLALRILGNLAEADDAVQDVWLKLATHDISTVENLEGWLTTATTRVCIDLLRKRKSRHETTAEVDFEGPAGGITKVDPESEALLADALGSAILVVLRELSPPERISFVLHDLFGVAFDEISALLGRTEASARQLASRGRRRVRGAPTDAEAPFAVKNSVVKAFLKASREGNFNALVQLLSPDAVWRADDAGVALGVERELAGAPVIAQRMLSGAKFAQFALVDGEPGFVGMVNGVPRALTTFTVADGRIVRIAFRADPALVAGASIVVIDNGGTSFL